MVQFVDRRRTRVGLDESMQTVVGVRLIAIVRPVQAAGNIAREPVARANWEYRTTLTLSSERVIDASVARLVEGGWRMRYNNEADTKSIYYADSLPAET